MDRFQWREAFRVGDGGVDDQHKRLFSLLAGLYREIHSKQAQRAVQAALQELLNYTRYHFSDEEQLMRAVGYPGYPAHKGLHDRLLAQVQEMSVRCQAGEEDMGIELLEFLNEWLVQHILEHDRAIGRFIRAQGESG